MKARYTYLGPETTFTETALLSLPSIAAVPAGKRQPSATIAEALEKVVRGTADAAMVPMENSVEGSVNAAVDAVAGFSSEAAAEKNSACLRIVREVLIPISFVLAAPQKFSAGDAAVISTHPHAWAQCLNWVQSNSPGADFSPASSTAAAAQEVARNRRRGHAVICSANTAATYGLDIISGGIQDKANAVTRFILVTTSASRLPKEEKFPAPTGADKTTLAVPLPQDKPGGLLRILDQFAIYGINLSRIESRPTGEKLGDYFFSIDLDGHIREARVRQALGGLYRLSPRLRFLGSYPRADRKKNIVIPHADDGAFRQSQCWLDSIEY